MLKSVTNLYKPIRRKGLAQKFFGDGLKYAKFAAFLNCWQSALCIFFTNYSLAEWAILLARTAHSVGQNGSFCRAKLAVLKCKTAHFVRPFLPNRHKCKFFLLSDTVFLSKKCTFQVLNFGTISLQKRYTCPVWTIVVLHRSAPSQRQFETLLTAGWGGQRVVMVYGGKKKRPKPSMK